MGLQTTKDLTTAATAVAQLRQAAGHLDRPAARGLWDHVPNDLKPRANRELDTQKRSQNVRESHAETVTRGIFRNSNFLRRINEVMGH